jgi:hypothetical protein
LLRLHTIYGGVKIHDPSSVYEKFMTDFIL